MSCWKSRLISGALVISAIAGSVQAAHADDDAQALNQPYYHQVWAEDSCVRSQGQDWDNYWNWVNTFYNGNIFQPGWTEAHSALVQNISNPTARAEILKKLDLLAQSISSEWAKEKPCRKIRSDVTLNASEPGKPSLTEFKQQLIQAAHADNGDGATLLHAVNDLQTYVYTLIHR